MYACMYVCLCMYVCVCMHMIVSIQVYVCIYSSSSIYMLYECYNGPDLMELAQVRGVHRFVSEDSVDGEVLARSEGLVLGEAVEHLRGDGGGVRAQEVLRGLFALEDAAVADAAVATVLVSSLHPLHYTYIHTYNTAIWSLLDAAYIHKYIHTYTYFLLGRSKHTYIHTYIHTHTVRTYT